MFIFTGKYTFFSQDNFENYLKAADIDMIQRNLIASTKPQMVIEALDGSISLVNITSMKNVTTRIPLDQEYSADPFAFGRTVRYVTTAQDDWMVTRDVANPESAFTMKFTEDGIVLMLTTKGVTGTRTFKRN